MIYHDRLSQWWEKECQEYIKDRGFGDRQWKLRGASNLNSNLFALVKNWVRKMCSITGPSVLTTNGPWQPTRTPTRLFLTHLRS